MAWSDFDDASALERDILERALPTVSSTAQLVTIDPKVPTHVAINVTDGSGPTPTGCVEFLALRPLLVGAAWKVIDLLLDEALDQAGVPPDTKRGYRIETKQSQARA